PATCLIMSTVLFLMTAERALAQDQGSLVHEKEERALGLFEQGLRHYKLGEYDAAINFFKQAYLLTDAPELLYNIAQSYRLKGAGHCGLALKFYKNYLQSEPETAKRASVDAVIADMDKCAREETSHAEAPKSIPAAQTRSALYANRIPQLTVK